MWYMCWSIPIQSVNAFGMIRPTTWPMNTASSAKWNRGEANFSSFDSYSCDERVVQPNWS